MSSKSVKNVIGVLVLVECTVKMFQAEASKSLGKLCDRVYRHNNECFQHWADLEKHEASIIHARIERFDAATFAGKNHHPATYTSAMLGLVEEIYRQVNGGRRRAIHNLIVALRGLHQYHDRKLDKFEAYALADRYMDQWNIA